MAITDDNRAIKLTMIDCQLDILQVLNKRDKEQLVVKLYQEGKSIRKIAQHRKIDGRDNDDGVEA